MQCTHHDYVWPVELTEINGKAAFSVPVYAHATFSNSSGTLYLTSDRVIYEPLGSSNHYESSRTSVGLNPGECMRMQIAQRKFNLCARATFDKKDEVTVTDWFEPCVEFIGKAISDFDAAEKKFNEIAPRLPSMRETAWAQFQRKPPSGAH